MTPAFDSAGSAALACEPREFSFDASDFQQIAALLYADSGIYLSPQKTTLVYGRLAKRLRALGLESFKDYCRLLTDGGAGDDERREMLCALTTNVTSFFRERHHFDHLRSVELPKLLEGVRRGGRLRLWSAGCSKGHEAYSIAITVLGLMPDAADYDVKILATDIDSTVIQTARAGVYGADELAALPKADTARFFEPESGSNGDMVVSDKLRDLVTFRVLNLMEAWPFKQKFQAVFCRNVAIYFDAATQAALWSRFASVLGPRGLFCIGHSEKLSGDAVGCFEPVGNTMYRLIGGSRS